MRLREEERIALKKALKDFKGEIYLFGSRINPKKKGGDIDILLIPEEDISPLKLELEVKRRFFEECEEDIDVVIYRKGDPFCEEILKNAKRITLEEL
ncbi:MAG: nucleotidyltransferase domain-containing protein [Caldimicrobium sp.]